jgi:hypothetical protein
MLTFPGWNSIESASAYARAFTYAGWASLFLLGIFEILAHTYTARKDALVSAQVEDTRIKNDAEIRRLNKQVEVAGNVAAGAIGKAAQAAVDLDSERRARLELEPRTLSKGQADKMSLFLSTQQSWPLGIVSDVNSPDAGAYADEIANVFRANGWTVDALLGTFPRRIKGIWIIVGTNANLQAEAFVLHDAFKAAGIDIRVDIDKSKSEYLALNVGFK